MLFDLVSYSGWLIAALGIGLVVGWRTYLDAPRRTGVMGGSSGARSAFVIGVIVAALKLLPDATGCGSRSPADDRLLHRGLLPGRWAEETAGCA